MSMKELDIPKMAFCTHYGHHQFQMMPFNVMNAPVIIMSLMNRVLSPC